MTKQSFIFFIFFFFVSALQIEGKNVEIPRYPKTQRGLVSSLIKIDIPGFEGAYNPSLLETDDGIVLSFRYQPDPIAHWISYIGIVVLDEGFRPISKPILLKTRAEGNIIPSQSEDARLFNYQGDIWVMYNDNPSFVNPSVMQRRNIYVSKLMKKDGEYILSSTQKLFHPLKYSSVRWQKNWVPFEWNNALLVSYSIIPHEVLYADLESGECFPLAEAPFSHPMWKWKWGSLRGGTPATVVNGEYLAFFHSSALLSSPVSGDAPMVHYFFGAYTFSTEPPFEIQKISPSPIMADNLYTSSSCEKRVAFPGGYIVRDPFIYVAYGKDDREVWIAMIDMKMLENHLIPVADLGQK